ncbi:MAG: hypothetical protein JSS79_07545 [Bacteroidetes bacterium]|nr:hypothetical protein [Bacteroidota bacterium]
MTNQTNVTVTGASLTKTAGAANTWDAGAFSVQPIPANTNGWIEFTAGETTIYKIMGLSSTDGGAGYTTINYGFDAGGDGTLYVFENGARATNNALGTYTTSDVLRVERSGTNILYKKNGVVVYTSAVQSSSVLYADCSFYAVGATFNNVSMTILQAPTTQWTNLMGTTAGGDVITKSGSTTGWDAGAFSVQSIPANMNGYVQFTTGESTKFKIMGLSSTDIDAGYTTINYALDVGGDGYLYVYEGGVQKANKVATYTTSDVFRVERIGTSIVYKKNGVVLYTSTTPSSGVLYADCSLYNPGSTINNLTISCGQPTQITKSIDYTYDFLGNVTQVAYQNLSTPPSDRFFHHYTYNADGKLTDVATSLDGTHQTAQAKYKYYLHGPLKRVELATNLQGIDYVYTINGALKSINHADLANDPGHDGSNGFTVDKFGETLNYFNNDYTGAAYNAGTLSSTGLTDYYSGQIKSAAWSTPIDNTPSKKMYGYTYDNLNRFQSAQWGTVTGTAGTYVGTPSGVNAYQESIGSYDKNGNILGLNRTGKTGNTLGNYTYNYNAGKNQLASVTGGTNAVNYTYNGIGQMVKQTEGTKTMNVTYNAYGLTQEVRDASNTLIESNFYDDRGDLVKKTIFNAGVLLKTTLYVRDVVGNPLAIYEQNGTNALALVEQPIYGTGRIGMMKMKKGLAKYFYELNDHLGNVRAVVGTPYVEKFTATMEPANAPVETKQFLNLTPSAIPYASANSTTGGSYVSRLNAQQNGGVAPHIMGPGIVLPVSPRDSIFSSVTVYFESGSGNGTSTLSAATTAAAIASAFTGGIFPGDPATLQNSFNTSFSPGGVFAAESGTSNDNVPHAYLNMIMFDGNLMPDASLPSAYIQIPVNSSPGVKQTISIPGAIMPTSGYVFIYVDVNGASPNYVYFDDLTVTQAHSPIVAGGDYYPFGLTMDDRQVKSERYRFGYQGQYAEKDSITNLNSFQLRLYEPRFGRWLSADPYGQFSSPYLAMGNNPTGSVDVDGGWTWETAAAGFAFGAGTAYATGHGDDWWKFGLAGGVIGGSMFEYEYGEGGVQRSWGATALGSKIVSNRRIVTSPFGSFFFRSTAVAARYLTDEEDVYAKMRKKAKEDGWGGEYHENSPEAIFIGKKGIMTTEAKWTYTDHGRKRRRKPGDDPRYALPHRIDKDGNYKYKVHGKWQKANAYAVGQNFNGPRQHTISSSKADRANNTDTDLRVQEHRELWGFSEFRVVTPDEVMINPNSTRNYINDIEWRPK